jgi:hypothetical protein
MDEIVGIAILTSDINPADGYEYLFVTCASPSRKMIDTAAIPIRERGKPNPGSRGWQYVIDGDLLHVTPSLKMSIQVKLDEPNRAMREIFHNSGAWTVKFIRKPLDQASESLHTINRDLRDSLREKWQQQS